MKRYKLLNQDRTTYGGMDWPIGEWREATGAPGQSLCTDGWLHCYDSPELALMLNPIHADITDPILCVVETQGRSRNDMGFKRGYRRMRAVRDIEYASPTLEQRVRFAILCAKAVYTDAEWVAWADRWLSGEDRAIRAASRAADTAYAAVCDTADVHAAIDVAARAAARAVRAAARAAYAAIYVDAAAAAAAAADAAAQDTGTAADADAAADAADAARDAAARAACDAVYAVAYVAARTAGDAAAYAAVDIDLISLAKAAMEIA